MNNFHPPDWLKNRHIQSFLASSGVRRPAIRRRARALLAAQQPVVLDAGHDVRLHGLISRHADAPNYERRGLVVLIHGWEGSAESTYLLSASASLFTAGFDIFRLHLRDHGPSHELNREVFQAARLHEVTMAVKAACERYSTTGRNYLVGFSLGGNFVLRLAANAVDEGLALCQAVAVSPVLLPVKTMARMESGPAVYHKYFVNKWLKSLAKKSRAFPELLDIGKIGKMRSLAALTDYLVEHHTEFDNAEHYLNSYALTPELLQRIHCHTHIIAAADDPVIPAEDFAGVPLTEFLDVRVLPYGGHCGFIDSVFSPGWVDKELLRLFMQ
ncbi:MAG TPA: alpha/beta fold hydrolase [Rhodocyclaceae bacterium]|nr:alpha/beta fold hydrolase [Rhodocyclaceae bacterium]